jgi:hypothetical protein
VVLEVGDDNLLCVGDFDVGIFEQVLEVVCPGRREFFIRLQLSQGGRVVEQGGISSLFPGSQDVCKLNFEKQRFLQLFFNH